MARKAKQRISYVLPLASSPGGHRLGVNGLAVDSDQSILYSGGRDGVICAWDLNLDLQHSSSSTQDTSVRSNPKSKVPTSKFRRQIQAHTHWVNDITLVHNNSALVSASSDITVKIWRPHSTESQSATTIGLHSDYAKCLASPSTQANWIASGGLDRKIRLWDLNGKGEKLHIDVGDEENSAKGSIYALRARDSIMASGGPESIVRLWDPRTGKRITKLVGHTDNVRDILLNQEGDTVMTASSDQTVKVWSITAGRCLYTLSMHNHSVWCLYSNHPQLSIFYSADRSGLVAKTDTRASAELDQGLSLTVAQEHEGIGKLVAAGDYFWTATSSSSINRWKDVDTQAQFHIPDSLQRHHEASISNIKFPSPVRAEHTAPEQTPPKKSIPVNCVLRLSNASAVAQGKQHTDSVALSPGAGLRKQSEEILDSNLGVIVPIQAGPEETIEGQNGLIKHIMLNDRKRVLTMDTAGEVVMWDLLKCVPIQSFGKRHLEDVVPEVNTLESVANWCAVDTRTGTLAVILEENYCFDAEMYADELVDEDQSVFREDQRINLGKWVLRYLFADLIDEELRRDEVYRQKLQGHHGRANGHQRQLPPSSIQLPPQPYGFLSNPDDASGITPRAVNGYPATTPGLAIGVATPGAHAANFNANGSTNPPVAVEENSVGKRDSKASQSRASSGDYFSSSQPSSNPADSQTITTTTTNTTTNTDTTSQQPPTPGAKDDADKTDKVDKTKDVSSLFGKKFRMNFPKKLGRSSVEATKPPVVDEIKSEESDDKSSTKEEKIVEDNFLGTIQKMRIEYDEKLEGSDAGDNSLPLIMTPSPANETPVLKPPPFTPVIIQEDRPDSGGVADLYRGQVGSLGADADMIERTAPMWLGELLLRNQVPPKEIVKVSFVLLPFGDLLPGVASPDGNSRLNANRMLRAKKILSYVADRIEPALEETDPNALKPEEYLELYCQNQRIPDNMTLATLRAHVWKTGGDVMLYYKSNGRKPELERRHQLALQQQQQMEATGQ